MNVINRLYYPMAEWYIQIFDACIKEMGLCYHHCSEILSYYSGVRGMWGDLKGIDSDWWTRWSLSRRRGFGIVCFSGPLLENFLLPLCTNKYLGF